MNIVRVILLLLFFSAHAEADPDKTIRVATYIEPPFANFIDNEFIGENIEIAKLLATSMNYEAVFIHCPFARCMTMIKQGQADMIIAIRKTKAREKFLNYLTPPYYIQHHQLKFYTLADANIAINTYDDLKSLTVGALRGTKYFDQFDFDQQLKKVEVTSIAQLINLLKKQRIDTFLEREESVLAWIEEEEYQRLFKLAEYEYDNAVGVYVAISKKSPRHKDVGYLSTQLAKFVDDGTIHAIIGR